MLNSRPNQHPLTSALQLLRTRAQKMHAQIAHSTATFSIVWISFYRLDRLNTDFNTTELVATINVWNTNDETQRRQSQFKHCTTSKFHTVYTCGSQPLLRNHCFGIFTIRLDGIRIDEQHKNE